jgi:hypothetical protein
MKYKTREQIRLGLVGTGPILPMIKLWRQVRFEAGEDDTFNAFWRAHGACPSCAGTGIVTSGIDRETGVFKSTPCKVCE